MSEKLKDGIDEEQLILDETVTPAIAAFYDALLKELVSRVNVQHQTADTRFGPKVFMFLQSADMHVAEIVECNVENLTIGELQQLLQASMAKEHDLAQRAHEPIPQHVELTDQNIQLHYASQAQFLAWKLLSGELWNQVRNRWKTAEQNSLQKEIQNPTDRLRQYFAEQESADPPDDATFLNEIEEIQTSLERLEQEFEEPEESDEESNDAELSFMNRNRAAIRGVLSAIGYYCRDTISLKRLLEIRDEPEVASRLQMIDDDDRDECFLCLYSLVAESALLQSVNFRKITRATKNKTEIAVQSAYMMKLMVKHGLLSDTQSSVQED